MFVFVSCVLQSMCFDSFLRHFVVPFDRDLNLDLPVWQSRWRTARRLYSHRRRGVVEREHCPDSAWRDQHRKPNSGVRGPLRHSRLLLGDLDVACVALLSSDHEKRYAALLCSYSCLFAVFVRVRCVLARVLELVAALFVCPLPCQPLRLEPRR